MGLRSSGNYTNSMSCIYIYIFISFASYAIMSQSSRETIENSRDLRTRLWAEQRHCQPVFIHFGVMSVTKFRLLAVLKLCYDRLNVKYSEISIIWVNKRQIIDWLNKMKIQIFSFHWMMKNSERHFGLQSFCKS